jgi:hypothetical protein
MILRCHCWPTKSNTMGMSPSPLRAPYGQEFAANV